MPTTTGAYQSLEARVLTWLKNHVRRRACAVTATVVFLIAATY
jgi:hypothetical protein